MMSLAAVVYAVWRSCCCCYRPAQSEAMTAHSMDHLDVVIDSDSTSSTDELTEV